MNDKPKSTIVYDFLPLSDLVGGRVGGREKSNGMPRKLNTPSDVINIRLPKGPPRPEVVVLPWLDVRKPIKVSRIHFVPLAEAVATLGPEVGARLKELTGDLKDVFGVAVNPTVALRDGKPHKCVSSG